METNGPWSACTLKTQIGKTGRPGIKNKSSACGALCAFEAEVESGKVDLKLQMTDVEQCMLKQVCAGEGRTWRLRLVYSSSCCPTIF